MIGLHTKVRADGMSDAARASGLIQRRGIVELWLTIFVSRYQRLAASFPENAGTKMAKSAAILPRLQGRA